MARGLHVCIPLAILVLCICWGCWLFCKHLHTSASLFAAIWYWGMVKVGLRSCQLMTWPMLAHPKPRRRIRNHALFPTSVITCEVRSQDKCWSEWLYIIFGRFTFHQGWREAPPRGWGTVHSSRTIQAPLNLVSQVQHGFAPSSLWTFKEHLECSHVRVLLSWVVGRERWRAKAALGRKRRSYTGKPVKYSCMQHPLYQVPGRY